MAEHLGPNDGDQVPGHGPHILLELPQHRDVPAANCVAREPEPEPATSGVRELVVPRHDAGIERHAQGAAGRNVGALDGLGDGETGSAREGGADDEEDHSQGSH